MLDDYLADRKPPLCQGVCRGVIRPPAEEDDAIEATGLPLTSDRCHSFPRQCNGASLFQLAACGSKSEGASCKQETR